MDGLVVPQGVLQGPGDLHALEAELHGQRDGLVLEDAVAELVGLGREGVLEALPVLGRDLVADAAGGGDLDVVLMRKRWLVSKGGREGKRERQDSRFWGSG